MDIEILPSPDAIARRAFDEIAAAAESAVRDRGLFSLVLSGGGTPEPLFRLFAAAPNRDRLPWPHIHLFWGDERCVPPDQEGSSYGQARRLFINAVPIPAQNIHRARGEMPPPQAAENYRRQLAQFAANHQMEGNLPRFDLVLLGLGSDGHTASLFPHKLPPEAAVETVVAVTADYDGRPANRVTMTPLVFNNARAILFLVAGEKKAKAVSAVINGPRQPEQWPGQLIQPARGRLIWLLDQPAAALLRD